MSIYVGRDLAISPTLTAAEASEDTIKITFIGPNLERTSFNFNKKLVRQFIILDSCLSEAEGDEVTLSQTVSQVAFFRLLSNLNQNPNTWVEDMNAAAFLGPSSSAAESVQKLAAYLQKEEIYEDDQAIIELIRKMNPDKVDLELMKLLPTQNWDVIRRFDHYDFEDAYFSREGKVLLCNTVHLDKVIEFDLNTEQESFVEYDPEMHENVDRGVISPDEKFKLIDSSEEYEYHIINVETNEVVHTLKHGFPIWNFKGALPGVEAAVRIAHKEFSPDGKFVASASHNGTAKIFDVETGYELFSIDHNETVNTVHFSSDSNKLITRAGDGTVKLAAFFKVDNIYQFLLRNLLLWAKCKGKVVSIDDSWKRAAFNSFSQIDRNLMKIQFGDTLHIQTVGSKRPFSDIHTDSESKF